MGGFVHHGAWESVPVPERASTRVYHCQPHDHSVGGIDFSLTWDGSQLIDSRSVVNGQITYQRPTTWLTRAWDRLRELFPKRHP